jgi:hypothetical protein
MQYLSTSDYGTIALYVAVSIGMQALIRSWSAFGIMIGMQALIRSWSAFGIMIALHCARLIAMYFVWYRHAPKEAPYDAALTQNVAVAAGGTGLQ